MKKIEVWPVIHVVDRDLTLRNAGMAHRLGVAGVLMISMRGRDWEARRVACECKETFPGLKVGVNFLGLPSFDAYRMSQNQQLDATWSDRQDFYAGAVGRETQSTLRFICTTPHLFFAAVAFKGQPRDPLPGKSARLAASYGLIPTTSGPATGIPIDVEKLRDMRREMKPSDPLAIASGVTPENVEEILPYVTHILVSTGVSGPGDAFDAEKLSRLIERAYSFGKAVEPGYP